MIKAKFGDRVESWLLRGLPFLFRRPVDPNLLTVTGAGISLVAAGCFAVGEFFAGGLVMLAGAVFGVIYQLRGFAVAAWTHSLYDLYVLALA